MTKMSEPYKKLHRTQYGLQFPTIGLNIGWQTESSVGQSAKMDGNVIVMAALTLALVIMVVFKLK
jgi:hypothetical protein